MDFPAPGGPTISRLWNPAAAISAARLAVSCPVTSAKSGLSWSPPPSRSVSANRLSVSTKVRGSTLSLSSPRAMRKCMISRIFSAPLTRMPGITPPSLAFAPGTMHSRMPSAAAARTIGSTPLAFFSSPFSPSSPRNRSPSAAPAGTSSMASSIPTAMGRSKAVPSFLLSAGDKLTVIRHGGRFSPTFFRATVTRSLDSRTSVLRDPTIKKAGSPLAMSTSTETI